MNKFAYIIIGILIVSLASTPALAERVGMMLYVYPNVSQYYVNSSGALNTSSTDPYLSNDTTTIYFDETYLNGTIDDRAGSGHSNGDNCAAGEYPLGVNASGSVEGCTDATTEINNIDGSTNTSMKAYVDRLDDLDDFTDSGNLYQDDIGSDCSVGNYAYGVTNGGTLLCRSDNDTGGAESDPYWSANVTTCDSNSKLYFSGGSLACNADQGGAESDPYWTANQSDYYTSSQVDSLDTTTNTSMKAYVDSLDHTDDQICSEVTGCVTGAITEIDNWATDINNYPSACTAGQYVHTIGDSLTCSAPSYTTDTNASTACSGDTTYLDGDGNCDDISGVYLTSYTEDDPYWSANITACGSNSKLYFSGGSLACNSDQDTTYNDLDNFSDSLNTYQDDIGSSCAIDNYAYGVNDDGTLLCRADNDSGVAETDPYWSANVTACGSGNHLYFSGGSLACEADDDDPESLECGKITGNTSALCTITDTTDDNVDSSELDNLCNTNDQILKRISGTWQCADDATGGGGAAIWAVSNGWMHPNLTAGGDNDINVTSINASDWTNVTITESQISDLQAYLTSYTENDPYWSANVTTCDSNSKLYFSGGSLACNADQGATESDPYWQGNQTDYMDNITLYGMFYNKTEIDTQSEMETIWSVNLATDTEDSNTNDTMRAYVDRLDDLNDFTDTGNVYQDDIGSSCAIDNYAYGVNDDGTILCRADNDSAAAESDPYWQGNYTACASGNHLFFSGGNLACEADAGMLDIDNWATDVNDYPAACNAGEYVNALGDTLTCTDATTEINSIDGTTNTSIKAYIDALDHTDDQTCAQVSGCVESAITEIDNWAADVNNYPTACTGNEFVQGLGDTLTCSEPAAGAEADPQWLGNYTACASGNHLYFSGDSLACEADADTPDSDPYWQGNYTACASGNHLFFSGGNLACEADAGMLDIDNWAVDVNDYPAACNGGEYVNALGDTLTCTDATTEINSIDGTTNTSMKAYVDRLDDLNDFTDSGNVYQDDIGSSCAIDNYAWGVNDDGTLLCRADNDSGGTETDPYWQGNYTACAAGNHLYFSGDNLACEADDDVPDSGDFANAADLDSDGGITAGAADDTAVANDITVDSTKWINTTEGIKVGSSKKICLNEATCTSYIWYNGSATIMV